MRASIVPGGDPLVVFLNALPYLGAWWLALRIVFGRRFEPLEWIPLTIAAFGIPMALLDHVRPALVAEQIAAVWEMLPLPVLLGDCVVQWRRHCSSRPKLPGRDPRILNGCLPKCKDDSSAISSS